MPDFQATVIGAGVVGLAIAGELAKEHGPVVVLERHPRYGQETSSRNSEVIHAGLYYPRNSLKALLCIEGNRLLYELCEKFSVPHKRITKIITAVDQSECDDLERLFRRGLENGVDLKMLTAGEVQSMEPSVTTRGGIFSPTSGIVSAHGLMDCYYHSAVESGVLVQHNCEVKGINKANSGYEITIQEGTTVSVVTTETVINSAGLESDTIASLAGIDVDKAGYRLHYCKGSYFRLPGKYRNVVSRLVYPLPTKHSLGVHAVLDLSGGIKFGPDAEYLPSRLHDYSVDESKRRAFAASVRRLLPIVNEEDLAPDMSGIRPKLQKEGEPVKDFVIAEETARGLPGFINLVGIESPGLTAAPAIARYVAQLLT